MKRHVNRPSLFASDELKQAKWLLRIALKEFFKSSEKQLGDALKIAMSIILEAHYKANLSIEIKEGKAKAKRHREEMEKCQEIGKEQPND